MDTVLNLGLNDETVKGIIALSGDERFCLRLLPPLHPDVLQDRARLQARRLRGTKSRSISEKTARQDRRRHPCRVAQARWCEDFKQIARDASGRDFPEDPYEQLKLRHRGRLRLVEQQARHRLSQLQQDRPRPRHRRQRADDGLRQHGRRQRHRRRLHPQPLHRREEALRRLPRQRPGRGCRRGHPQHLAHRPAGR